MTEKIEAAEAVFEQTRSFNAPVERVYRAFTEAERLVKWGCGTSYDNIILDVDARPGGVMYHRVTSKRDGSQWTFFGVYQQVERNRKLSYSFDWKMDWREPATPSLVELTFHDRGDHTELELRHSRMPEPALESTEQHWNEFIGVLDEQLEAGEL